MSPNAPSVDQVAQAIRAGLPALADQADDLAHRVRLAIQQWPELTVDPERFLAHLDRHLATERSTEIAHLYLDELVLAYACGQGDPQAVALLEQRYLRSMHRVLGKLSLSPDKVEEVKQLVREALLVGARGAKQPQILSYSGWGRLRNFCRIIAFRTAYRLMEKGAREVPQEGDILDQQENLELQYLKQTYRAEFKNAFHEAIHLLTDRELSLLQFHYMERLTIDQIGGLYEVHRATAARWIAKARESLLQHTREQLRSSLQISGKECDSIVRLIESRMDITFPSLLRMR